MIRLHYFSETTFAEARKHEKKRVKKDSLLVLSASSFRGRRCYKHLVREDNSEPIVSHGDGIGIEADSYGIWRCVLNGETEGLVLSAEAFQRGNPSA